METNKVQGKEYLMKTDHGSVVNTDSDSYEAAKQRKRLIIEEKNTQTSIIDMLKNIQTRLSLLEDRLEK